jgi:hypothetical protein
MFLKYWFKSSFGFTKNLIIDRNKGIENKNKVPTKKLKISLLKKFSGEVLVITK